MCSHPGIPSLSTPASAMEGISLGGKDLSTKERPMLRGPWQLSGVAPEASYSKVVVQIEKITCAGMCVPLP